MARRVVLAYSGGLDTSVAVRWMQEEWGVEVVALAVDVGQFPGEIVQGGHGDFEAIRSRALDAGAVEAVVVDAKQEFADDFCVPAVQANALYEGKYPLVSALSRPVIARHLARVARETGADAVAHGCTGKGNDQVRFEVSVRVLAPELEVLAPVREWGFTREDSIEYAAKHGIPVTAQKDKLYSIDENLWGRTVECGILEDPWREAPDDIWERSQPAADGPPPPRDLVLGFEHGIPVVPDGRPLPVHQLVPALDIAVGAYGFGRIDMVENRRVGIKSREIYECPGSLALILAHADLESITVERDLLREKARIEPRYSELVYDGLWYSPLKEALDAFVASSQQFVTGEVRLRLDAGRCFVVGRRAPEGLYDYELATYDAADTFRHEDAAGFVRLWGLSSVVWSARQGFGRDPGRGTGRAGAGAAMTSGAPTAGGEGGRTLWHGRITEQPADELLAFTVSLPIDRRLAPDDIAGSKAHVAMLASVGLVTEEERALVSAALSQAEKEIQAGTFNYQPTDEDIHTAIERRVTELAGTAGAKLHTGRSRNDQVALDLRLFVRREGRDLARRIARLQQTLVARATEAGDAYLPGYTHLQRAQPVLLAHHFLAHVWALIRDVDRFGDALHRADVCPLGAGALAGSSLPLDPDRVAHDLGFGSRFENSLDAVSDRDFVAELLFACALTQVHLSRLGEEIVLWTTEEFGFCRLADQYSTGSSMMPQKKNPDIAELARGKAGRLIGDLTGFLATLKGLPLSYNRDLQEDKEPLFDAFDTLSLTVSAVTGMLATAVFDHDRMRRAADDAYASATDLAEDLVRRGVPFREAHGIVGGLVRQSIERGIPLDELVMTEPRLGPESLALLEPGASVRRRSTPGGGGPRPLAAQLTAVRSRLDAPAHVARGLAGGTGRPRPRRLPRSFFARDARVVGPELLHKVLVHDDPGSGERLAVRIVEVEAYLGDADPGSHAFRGPTPRNAVMFGPAGHLYVYFTYGMHWCANVVTGRPGVGTAVLLRAGAPLQGADVMAARRPKAWTARDLCSGPARLTQALGIDKRHNGSDLCGPRAVLWIGDDGTPPPATPGVSTRIGLRLGAEHPWRWYVVGDPNVSRSSLSRSRA